MRFTRTLSVKHHPNGDHYEIAIPAPVAEALHLQDGGGLVSIELPFLPSKKGSIHLQAYRDTEIAWREQFFDPSNPRAINKAVAIPPRTLGPSKPWGRGKITDWRQDLREIRASFLWINAEFRKTFPRRRGRGRRRW